MQDHKKLIGICSSNIPHDVSWASEHSNLTPWQLSTWKQAKTCQISFCARKKANVVQARSGFWWYNLPTSYGTHCGVTQTKLSFVGRDGCCCPSISAPVVHGKKERKKVHQGCQSQSRTSRQTRTDHGDPAPAPSCRFSLQHSPGWSPEPQQECCKADVQFGTGFFSQ